MNGEQVQLVLVFKLLKEHKQTTDEMAIIYISNRQKGIIVACAEMFLDA